jgi:hypothetical protein
MLADDAYTIGLHLLYMNEDITLRKQFFMSLIEENYWYILAWYVIIDEGTIFNTSFEYSLYFLVFWVNVHVCAIIMNIDSYVKNEMDNEIN